MWDLIVSVPDHCLSIYFSRVYIISTFYGFQLVFINDTWVGLSFI